MVGVGLLQSFLPVQMHFSLGCLTLNSSLSPAQGFAAELIYTFILVFVVFAVAVDPFAGLEFFQVIVQAKWLRFLELDMDLENLLLLQLE